MGIAGAELVNPLEVLEGWVEELLATLDAIADALERIAHILERRSPGV